MGSQNRKSLLRELNVSKELLADQIVHVEQCEIVILFDGDQKAAQVCQQIKPEAVSQAALDLGVCLLQAYIQHADSNLTGEFTAFRGRG